MRGDRSYLIFVSPEPGHIAPARELGLRLQKRGAKIVFAVTPPMAALLYKTGFTLVNMAGDLLSDDEEIDKLDTRLTNALCGAPTGHYFWFQATGESRGRRGPLIAEALSKLISCWPGFTVLVDFLFSSSYGLDLQSFDTRARIIRIAASLPAWDLKPEALQGKVLILCPKILEIASRQIQSKDLCYGFPCVSSLPWGPESCSDLEEWQAGFEASILVCFGTQIKLHTFAHERIIRIMEWVEAHPNTAVILAAGSERLAHLAEEGATTLANLRVRRAIPQRRLLDKCSLMISHGGLGSIKESVLAGVPMVVFPAHADQPLNAARIEQLGLGRAVFQEEITRQGVADAIDDVLLTSKYRSNVTSLSHVLRQEEQSTSSLEFIEQ